MPEATAPVFSNRECNHGTRHADSGHGVVKISKHPVALAIITSGPADSVTKRAAKASPHPKQARCPDSKPRKRGCFARNSVVLIGTIVSVVIIFFLLTFSGGFQLDDCVL
jgi:hypothetical protein